MTFVFHSEDGRRHYNAAKADALLARLDALEEIAEAIESDDEIPSARERLAARYRKLIGVEAGMRSELRARLELIARNGHQSVDDVVAGLR